MDEFTYYGDLVGIKSAYAASPTGAYNLLSEYYNEVFHGLDPYYRNQPQRKIEMFSDSLMITGDNPEEFVAAMSCIYGNLLSKGILLRGAMVSGRLAMDMRVTAENFRKNLPDSDVLARAVILETQVKGARFVVESKLAQKLMEGCESWLSTQGYATNPRKGDRTLLPYRSLLPLDNGFAWEVLYALRSEIQTEQMDHWKGTLTTLSVGSSPEVNPHYQETINLLERSCHRLAHHRG